MLISCAPMRPPRSHGVDLVVVAPHPDDEVLMAGGVLEQAVRRGQRARVIVLTNGDFTCSRDGAVRQNETVAAMRDVGLQEEDVHFLGYPDGHLKDLGGAPLTVERRTPDGQCVQARGTWRVRGLPRPQQPLTDVAVVRDLVVLLSTLQPRDVYLPHGSDAHPDHAMTAVFVRRALEQLSSRPRSLHSAVVHTADGVWPSDGVNPFRPDRGMPSLPAPWGSPTERVAIDPTRKLALINHYPSQLDGPLTQDWLSSFARTEEVFFVEALP
jgi:LmbE family N-acetylglucosaminyl deacetylase